MPALKKVIVIDDDDFVLKTFKYCLDEEELKHIDFFTSPEEAIKSIGMNKYSRIISDWRFTNSSLNGFDILNTAEATSVSEQLIMTSVSKLRQVSKETILIRKPLTKKTINIICNESLENIRKISA